MMSENEFRKLIAKVENWISISVKNRRKIIKNFILDEAYLGSEKNQDAYRAAMSSADKKLLDKLQTQSKTRRRKALEWLTTNGY